MSIEVQWREPQAAGRKARSPRKPMTLKAFIAGDDGVVSDARLIDLSYDGCGVRCDKLFEVGEQVRLSVMGRGAMAAHVRWCRDGVAGLQFGTPEEPAEVVSKRVLERVLLEATVNIRRQGGAGFRVRVHDASPEGCRVDDLERYRSDEAIWVRFPGLEPLEARLCWRDEFTAGLKFLTPIHPAVFGLLLTRLGYSAKQQ